MPFAHTAKGAAPGKDKAGRAKLAGVVIALLMAVCSASAQKNRAAATNNSEVVNELRIVSANVQMLLVAPDGKETGYDPKLKTKVRQISDSAYDEDALLAFDSGRVDPNTTQTIDVRSPAAGKYRLVVSPGTAADGEEYEIRVSLYLQGGAEQNIRIAGTAKRGRAASYEMEVNAGAAILKVFDRAAVRDEKP